MTLAGLGDPYGMPADPYGAFGENPADCFPTRTLPPPSGTYPQSGGGIGQNSLEQLLIPILRLVLQLVQQMLGSHPPQSGNERQDGLYGQWKDRSYGNSNAPVPPEMPYIVPPMPYDEFGSAVDPGASAGSSADSSAETDGASAQAEAEAAAAAQRRAQAEQNKAKIDAARSNSTYVAGLGMISASRTPGLWKQFQANLNKPADADGNTYYVNRNGQYRKNPDYKP